MTNFSARARDFLTQERIAVAGVSRSRGAANNIYCKLRDEGYQVFPVNPHADVVEGDACYPNLRAIPGNIGGVVIVTPSDVTRRLVRECAEVGVPRVWMHENGFMGAAASSVSEEAVVFCNQQGLTVIAGGCPMMFLEFGHKCMRWFLRVAGRLPE